MQANRIKQMIKYNRDLEFDVFNSKPQTNWRNIVKCNWCAFLFSSLLCIQLNWMKTLRIRNTVQRNTFLRFYEPRKQTIIRNHYDQSLIVTKWFNWFFGAVFAFQTICLHLFSFSLLFEIFIVCFLFSWCCCYAVIRFILFNVKIVQNCVKLIAVGSLTWIKMKNIFLCFAWVKPSHRPKNCAQQQKKSIFQLKMENSAHNEIPIVFR